MEKRQVFLNLTKFTHPLINSNRSGEDVVDLGMGNGAPHSQTQRRRNVQVRVFRQEDGLFTVVTSPRKRYGLVPVITKDLDKAGCVTAVLAEATKEDSLREAVRAAKDAILRP